MQFLKLRGFCAIKLKKRWISDFLSFKLLVYGIKDLIDKICESRAIL